MQKNFIVVGDPTSGGGHVLSGSPATDIDGKPVARVGDRALCRKHSGTFSIVGGNMTVIMDGQAIALHGDYLSCGCQVLSGKQSRVFVDEGMGSAEAGAEALPGNALLEAIAQKPPVCKECLLAGSKSGAAVMRR
ncbi:PAAR domain-containing protein [Xanthomonas translucens]|uniref:PAAR domain-containing protein n=1 Tax=Xanthomonas campestris pv. translucens TaxID=343 RepID=UPI00071E6D08|nr:PAAR domain-containing protein [Xanthomonas translucens]AVY65627.1 PAAR motif family protein [Xanthomonas translucens pv. undulosa]QEO25550.1 PAAR domain-containing protein [Xanthomonas translucens pv. undulosa]WLA01565.1 PAAR domain-containing protein [Xanthomonas translucens]WLA08429.1 PAAR domain-containing protein [Xanthomonas translucens]